MSNATVHCYHCAETIRAEANRCRFCGQEITAANRIGLPNWYRETGQCGLSLLCIIRDLENRATGDTGHVVLEGSERAILYAYGNKGDREASECMFVFHEFVGDRLAEIHKLPSAGLEAGFLYPLMILTMNLRSLLRNEDHWYPENLDCIANQFRTRQFDKNGDHLPDSLREELSALLNGCADELCRISSDIEISSQAEARRASVASAEESSNGAEIQGFHEYQPSRTGARLWLWVGGGLMAIWLLSTLFSGNSERSTSSGVRYYESQAPGSSFQTGRWSGWYVDQGRTVAFDFDAIVEGPELRGTISEILPSSGSMTRSTVNGTIDGNSVAFSKRYPSGVTVRYRGTVQQSGGIRGTWENRTTGRFEIVTR